MDGCQPHVENTAGSARVAPRRSIARDPCTRLGKARHSSHMALRCVQRRRAHCAMAGASPRGTDDARRQAARGGLTGHPQRGYPCRGIRTCALMNFGSARKSNVGTITCPGYSGVLTYPGYSEVLRGAHLPRARPCVLTVPGVSASARKRTLSTEAASGGGLSPAGRPAAAASGGGQRRRPAAACALMRCWRVSSRACA